MPTLVICYFTISIFLFLPALNSCLNCCGDCFYFSKILLFIYLVAKIIILSIIVSILKDGLNKEWENNICENLKGLSSFSYIYNIIMICLSGIYFIVYLVSACYANYNESDYPIDYGGYY